MTGLIRLPDESIEDDWSATGPPDRGGPSPSSNARQGRFSQLSLAFDFTTPNLDLDVEPPPQPSDGSVGQGQERVPRTPRPVERVGPSLGDLFAKIRVNERDWQILYDRHGVGQRQTLQEVADRLGLTRERVRQITVRLVKRLQREQPSFDVWLSPLETKAWALPASIASGEDLKAAIDTCLSILQDASLPLLDEKDVLRLWTIVRALAYHDAADTSERWRFLTFVACRAYPPIGRLPDIADEIAHAEKVEREKTRRRTYRELIQLVLGDAGEPLHWTSIVDRVKGLGQRDTVESGGIRNVLHTFPDIFVRVAAGTYGLRAWGLERVPFYPDVISSVLATAGCPLAQSEISVRMEAIRPIKDTSLMFYLTLNPRFYGSVDHRFGLREWLTESPYLAGESSAAWREHPASCRRMDQRSGSIGDPDEDEDG